MKTISKTTIAVIAAFALTSSAFAAGWDWERDAGAKMRGEFGGKSAFSSRAPGYSYTRGSVPAYSNPSVGAEPSVAYRGFSYQPAPAIKAGDSVSVVPNGASLMVGTQVVGTVARGQRLTVSVVQGPWLGTTIAASDGRSISGWIRGADVTLAR